jgi:hypothetical protein
VHERKDGVEIQATETEVEGDIDESRWPDEDLKRTASKQGIRVIGQLTDTREATAQILVKRPVETENIILKTTVNFLLKGLLSSLTSLVIMVSDLVPRGQYTKSRVRTSHGCERKKRKPTS